MNMVRSMVCASGLTLNFWGDAAEHAACMLTRSPTKENDGGVSPIEVLNLKKTNLSDIPVFGSTRTVHLHIDNKSLGAREKATIIIGKNEEMKGYRVYLTKERVFVVTQHVKNNGTLNTMQNDEASEDHDNAEGLEESQDDHDERPATSRSSG
uniref:Retroviral polymerase SH3-like domain-containing protein n=1 Tax=Peronospora matthiolae TaxID=2874970 RepID=A0AAV1UR91_9STRA